MIKNFGGEHGQKCSWSGSKLIFASWYKLRKAKS